VVFVPDPVCWTEVPESFSQLAAQRRRWARGLTQLLRKHRRMIGNPRYGGVGVVALPYCLAFELFGPAIELLGLAALVAGLAFGAVSWWFAAAFAVTAAGYGVFVSSCALAIEEFAFHRYHRWGDLQRSFAAALVEFFGYRQLHAWWRLLGMYDELRGRETAWGDMVGRGFAEPPETSIDSTSALHPDAAGIGTPEVRVH
jgi:cellulose synthase/poly-beta-1,6-N-acetylglucosamine synthase-like glycosyltransferase